MATDQTSIAKAAAASISKMSKATLAAAESQKKQNEYIEKFNVLIKERIELEEQDQQLHTSFTEQINNAARDLKENYEGIKRSVIEISKVLLQTISELKSMTSQIDAATIATIQFQKAQKGQLSMFGFLSGKAAGFAMNIGKSVLGAAKSAFGSLGKITSGFSKIATKALDLVSKHPIIFAIVQVIKKLKMLASVVTGIFFGGIMVATKFAKTMAGLPLQIVGSAAKIGHSFRKDVVETIGNSVLKLNEFIDTNDGLGASIKKMSTSSAVSLDKFQDVGSDLVKLFGPGAGGLAAMIEASGQALVDMGQFADVAGGSIANLDETFEHFYKATKSLGFAGKDIEYITAEAVKNGESIYTALDRVVVAGDATAKQFSLDRKKLSKNFMELRTDITNFGHLSDSQLMQTTAKLTQMGLSMKEASAVFGKIDTFESAAQTSAMLSQTFGMNVDALQLLKAEKPEEIIEQFRDAMLSTGRSFDDLNRHEKSLMATHTGLSEQALKMTMNYRTLGMSYTDIQKKMKEDDPTQQQIKNLKLMSGSLKEIKRTLTGDNMFRNFADGVMNTIKTASGLSPVLLRVSKRFEDFFLSGLKVSKGAKSALVKAFSPFTTVLEEMVGDGKSKKGLLDSDKFKGTFETFAIDMGGFFERIFSGKENLTTLQNEFSKKANKIFSFASFNKGNNFVGTLMKSGGKIVGQLLKAFTAIGPGLIDVFATTLEDLVNWLDSDITSGDNSLAKVFSKLFNINETDSNAMVAGLTKIFDTIVEKILPSLFKLGKPIFKFVYDTVTTIVSTAWNVVTKKLEGTRLGATMFSLSSGQEEAAEEREIAKTLGMDVSDIDNNLVAKLTQGYDLEQARGVGQLQAIVEKNINKSSTTSAERLELEKVSSMLKEIVSTNMHKRDSLGDYDNYIKKSLNTLEKYSSSRNITLEIGKVEDYASNMAGANNLGFLKQKPDGNYKLEQTAVGDQGVAGKSDGPIVGAIAYAGNAANAALQGIQGVVSALTGAPVATAGGGLSEITIRLEVDGNTLTEVVLDSDIVGKMTNPIKGRKVLSDGAVVDAAGSRVQSSSMIG